MHLDPPLPWYPNYGDHRHWKYWENYNWHSDASEVRLEHGRWICREWNRRHTGDQVVMRHKTHYFVYGPEYGLSFFVLSFPDSISQAKCAKAEERYVGSQLLLRGMICKKRPKKLNVMSSP